MQERTKISLYDCLYGNNIQRAYLDEYGVRNVCMKNVIEIFRQAHHAGNQVGPINLWNVIIDGSTGEVQIPKKMLIDEMFNTIDTIKCLPPRIISAKPKMSLEINENHLSEKFFDKQQLEESLDARQPQTHSEEKTDEKMEFTIYDDNYCLALLLFIIRYNAFPFDGKLVYEKPMVTKNQALKRYGYPIFVFDDNNTTNEVYAEQSSDIIKRWYHDENRNMKTLFLQMFTIGITGSKYSVQVKDWEEALKDSETDNKLQDKTNDEKNSEQKNITSHIKNSEQKEFTDDKKNDVSSENMIHSNSLNGNENNRDNMKNDKEIVTKICNEVNYIETDEIKIDIIAGREIYERDLGIDTEENKKICVVVKNNKDERVLALGNCTDDTWSLYLPNSKEVLVMPKQVAPVVKGAMICIGELIINIT